ncbi:MAG TPA: hypothetical protein VL242_38570, partial [Sorangium sp.]|nr:hypothetical protein [Sorangium sp.]
ADLARPRRGGAPESANRRVWGARRDEARRRDDARQRKKQPLRVVIERKKEMLSSSAQVRRLIWMGMQT